MAVADTNSLIVYCAYMYCLYVAIDPRISQDINLLWLGFQMLICHSRDVLEDHRKADV